MPGIKRKNVVIANCYSFLMHVIEIGKDTVNCLRAERPARPPVRENGSENRTTGITSKDRKM